MSREADFPSPAKRFERVGFSEIVRVRNRVLALLAEGHRVWRFEGGEPYMPTPQPIKDAILLRVEAVYDRDPSNQKTLLERADDLLENLKAGGGGVG